MRFVNDRNATGARIAHLYTAMSPKVKWRLAIIAIILCVIVLLYLILTRIPIYIYVLVIALFGVASFYNARDFHFLSRLGLNPRRGLTIPPVLINWLPGWSASKESTSRRRNRVLLSVNSSESENTSVLSDVSYNCSFYPRHTYMDRPDLTASRSFGRTRLSTPKKRLSYGGGIESPQRILSPGRPLPLHQTRTKSLGVLPQPWESFHQKSVLKQRNPAIVQSAVRIAKPDSSPNISTFFDHLNAHMSPSESFQRQPEPCSRETVLNVLRERRKRDVDKEDKMESSDGQYSKRSRHDSVGSAGSGPEPLLANGAPSLLEPKAGQKRWLNGALAEESVTKRSRTSSISSGSGGPSIAGVRNPIHSSYSSSRVAAKRKSVASSSNSPSTSLGSPRPQTPVRAAKKLRDEALNSPSSSFGKPDEGEPNTPSAKDEQKPCTETPKVAATNGKDPGSQRRRKIPLLTHNKDGQIPLPPAPELGYTITVEDLDRERKASLSQIQKLLEEPEPEKPAPDPAPASTATSTSLFSVTSTTVVASTSTAASTTTSQDPSAGTPPASSLASATASSTSTVTLPSVIATPAVSITTPVLGATTAAAAPFTAPAPTTLSGATLGLPGPPMGQPNPLLESLKAMKSPVFGATTTTTTSATAQPTSATIHSPATMAPAAITTDTVKSEGSAVVPPLTAPVSTSRAAPNMNSAFAQVLAQPLQLSSSTATGNGLFGLAKPTVTIGATSTSLACTSAPSTGQTTVTAGLSTSVTGGFGAGTSLTSGFKPIFGAPAGAPASTQEAKSTPVTFPNIFGPTNNSVFGQAATSSATVTTTAPAANTASGVGGGGGLFGGLAANQSNTVGVPPVSSATSVAPAKSLFGGWGAPTTRASASGPAAASNTFQFGAPSTAATAAAPPSTTASSTTSAFQFGSMQPQPPPSAVLPTQTSTSQGGFTFGQPAASTTTPFGGFAMGGANAATTAPATVSSAAATQPASVPVFGNASSASFGSTSQAPTIKPVTFGAGAASAPGGATGGSTVSPFTFGGAGNSTTGSTATAAPAFGSGGAALFGAASNPPTAGFSFGGAAAASTAVSTSAGPAMSTFGTPSTQTAAPPTGVANPTFAFGGTNQNTIATSNTGFNFGTPSQTPSFSFGGGMAPNFLATSTPFNQSAAGAPINFGSPQQSPQAQGFNAQTASPFGNTPMASFSIGAGSKPSRQRLQARRIKKK